MRRSLLMLAAALAAICQAQETDNPPAQLLELRRVYVEPLSGGDSATQIRDMIISSLQGARLFVITENQERADVIMRGSAEDLIFTDTFQSSEGLNARASVGSRSVSVPGQGTNRTGPLGVSVGQNEATRIAERKHEAVASVRLVNKDGDVIWSNTQESTGAKFRGASADVADKVTRQLIADIEKARRSTGEVPKSE
ncbi:MAG: hypothetical protein ACRD7E_17595 [Bryobacteraceae bacterium]